MTAGVETERPWRAAELYRDERDVGNVGAHPRDHSAGVDAERRPGEPQDLRRRAVAPFVILHDRTLDAIAASLPRSTDDLEGIFGIGPSKLAAYGDAILSVVSSVAATLKRSTEKA